MNKQSVHGHRMPNVEATNFFITTAKADAIHPAWVKYWVKL